LLLIEIDCLEALIEVEQLRLDLLIRERASFLAPASEVEVFFTTLGAPKRNESASCEMTA